MRAGQTGPQDSTAGGSVSEPSSSPPQVEEGCWRNSRGGTWFWSKGRESPQALEPRVAPLSLHLSSSPCHGITSPLSRLFTSYLKKNIFIYLIFVAALKLLSCRHVGFSSLTVIEPGPPASGAQSLSQKATRKVPYFFFSSFSPSSVSLSSTEGLCMEHSFQNCWPDFQAHG